MMPLTRISTLFPPPFIRMIKPLAMPILSGRMRRLYSSFISPGDLVFDIGAHTGDYTKVFLGLGARVVCLEPNPWCTKKLARRFAGRKDVTIVGKGVGEKAGELEFSVCDDAPALSTFSDRWKSGRYSREKWERKMMVGLTTLDSLVREFGKPAFCKIDVEGFEVQVIRGLGSSIPSLSFEFTKEFIGDVRTCAGLLSALGPAKFNYSVYSEFRLASGEWLSGDSLVRELESLGQDDLCGDVYVRFGDEG
jgi:FkbM family methyltransferase